MRAALLVLLFCLYSPYLTAQNYLANRVVFKVQPSYESFCQNQDINIPGFQTLVNQFGIKKCYQKFPHSGPVEGKGKIDLRYIYEWEYSANAPVETVVSALQGLKGIAWAEPHLTHELMYDPSDPDTASQYWIGLLQARQAWDINTGDTNVVIGIVDAAIQFNHPDLIGNLKYNWADPINGIDDDHDGYVDNFMGWDLAGFDASTLIGDNNPSSDSIQLHHGTSVAGYAAATSDNNEGVVGVAFHCKFLPIKTAAESDYANVRILMGYEGIVYAADKNCAVINCSFGSTSFSYLGQDVIAYATYNRNALVVAAAGNSNNTVKLYPASYPLVLCVGATNASDVKGPISSYGKQVDVMAPGSSKTTAAFDTYTYSGQQYTSYASPIAAGVAAMVKSQNPGFTAEQVREKVRVTAENIDLLNSGYAGLLGKGRVNLYRALTINSPSVRYQQINVSDGNNNIPESGDSIAIVISFKNFLTPTSALVVSLSSSDPNITISANTKNLGVLNTLATKANNSSPFVVKISPSTPANYILELKLSYADGLYTDAEYFEIIVNPTYRNITNGILSTTVTHTGNYAYANFPTNTLGLGFLNNQEQLMYESGFLVGHSASVSDNIRKSGSAQSKDFRALSNVQVKTPGSIADVEAYIQFNDDGADTTKLNYTINQANFMFSGQKFIINRYSIFNKNLFLQDSVYAGLFADFDIGNSSFNRMEYDSSTHLLYAYSSEAAPHAMIGITPLHTGDSIQTYATQSGSFLFQKADKWNALKGGSTSVGLSGNGVDVLAFLSAGPFQILPLDSHIVAFAWVSGSNLTELKQNAIQAQKKYACLFSGNILQVDLGPDIVTCGSATLTPTTTSVATYLWNTGQTTPSITVSNSGMYNVVITDSNGCSTSDQIQVTITPAIHANYQVSQDTLFAGDTLYCTDHSTGATAWNWNFGNGFGSFAQNPAYAYPSPGTYTLQLVVGNGQCTDTVSQSIVVQQNVARESLSNPYFTCWPNPIHDKLWIQPHSIQAFSLTLTDITGKVLIEKQIPMTDRYELDLSGFPPSMYMLQINQTYIKIIKQ